MRVKLPGSWVGVTALFAFTLVGAAPVDQPAAAPASRPLVESVPAGPLLVLEAHDFASLVHDWSVSREKQLWLESASYATFSRSRLFLRLQDAQAEFAAAAGLPPDMSLVESAAGGESALALYDIGKLEFLYLTRMPQAQAVETSLWRARGNYEPRESAGKSYFVHVDPSSRRVVAFAATDDVLLLATREDLIAGALATRSGQERPSVTQEPWFRDAAQAAGNASPGTQADLRLVLNLPVIVKSPYFRSYWVQGNVAEMRQYHSAIADLYRSPGEIREKRVLLRAASPADGRGPQAGAASQPARSAAGADHQAELGELLRLAPPEAGFYRAWATPSTDAALGLLQEVLAPRNGPAPAGNLAPAVSLAGGEAGTESDLETRIDEASAAATQDRFGREALRQWLNGSQVEAALEIESSQPSADGVFIRTPSAVAFRAAADWDGDRARNALQSAIQELWTTSRLGVAWTERGQGAESYYELDGLARLGLAARGRVLIVADDASLLGAVLGRISQPAPPGGGEVGRAVYAARFDHAREAASLSTMLRLIDAPFAKGAGEAAAAAAASGREPLFFSENIASLSRTLARVESASIVDDDRGSEVDETVVYRLKQ